MFMSFLVREGKEWVQKELRSAQANASREQRGIEEAEPVSNPFTVSRYRCNPPHNNQIKGALGPRTGPEIALPNADEVS
jgi:hypothetical protein